MSTTSLTSRIARPAACAASAAALALTGAASADTFNSYWSAETDGNYNEGSNWSEGVVPFHDGTDQHSVYINTNVVTLNTPGHTANFFYLNRSLTGAPSPTAGTTLKVTQGGSLSVVRFRPAGESIVSIEGGSVTGTTEVAIGYQSGTTTVNLSAGSLNGPTAIGHGGSGILNISGTGQGNGSLTVGGSASTGAEVNQTGGSWAAVALSIGNGGPGTYNLGAGTVTLSSRLRIGSTATGTMNITGGTLTADAFSTYLGGQNNTDGVGTLVISGGTTSMSKGMVLGGDNGNGGEGTLHIVGSGGSLSLAGGGLDVHANSTLIFEINPTGIATIDITGGSSTLAGALDIALGGGFAPAPNETFDLISSTAAIDTTGLNLAAEDQPYWSFAVVNEGGRNILRLTNTGVIPEPASLALLGLGGALMLARRRQT